MYISNVATSYFFEPVSYASTTGKSYRLPSDKRQIKNIYTIFEALKSSRRWTLGGLPHSSQTCFPVIYGWDRGLILFWESCPLKTPHTYISHVYIWLLALWILISDIHMTSNQRSQRQQCLATIALDVLRVNCMFWCYSCRLLGKHGSCCSCVQVWLCVKILLVYCLDTTLLVHSKAVN